MRYFLALARHGAVRAAGTELGVSHSTVARRVEALEAQLGTRLFDRHRDGYLLTDAGREMLPRAEGVEREMCALERTMVGQDEQLSGRVSLTCCDEYISGLIFPALAQVCSEHRELDLCLTTDGRYFDLSKREADIALRILGPEASPPEHLIGRSLVPICCASYVARAHASKLDPSIRGSRPRWAAFGDMKTNRALVAGSSYPDLPLWGAFTSLTLMLQAVRQGLGLAMLPCYIGDRDPALRRLDPADLRHLADLWVLSHADLRDNTRFQTVRYCVSDALRQLHDLFAGDEPQPET